MSEAIIKVKDIGEGYQVKIDVEFIGGGLDMDTPSHMTAIAMLNHIQGIKEATEQQDDMEVEVTAES